MFSRSAYNFATGSGQVKFETAPRPNNGEAKKHGGDKHNDAIDNRVKELKELEKQLKVRDIRKNQRQVDVDGNKKGRNQPDIQYDELDPVDGKWYHVAEEYDNKLKQSIKHRKVIEKVDPSTRIRTTILD